MRIMKIKPKRGFVRFLTGTGKVLFSAHALKKVTYLHKKQLKTAKMFAHSCETEANEYSMTMASCYGR